MTGERSSSRTSYLRRPWTQGRIGGRTAKGGLLILLALLVYFLFFGDAGWFRQMRLQSRRGALEERVVRLETEEERLREELRLLREDPDYREKVAREEWGYQRPGERVYQITRPEPNE